MSNRVPFMASAGSDGQVRLSRIEFDKPGFGMYQLFRVDLDESIPNKSVYCMYDTSVIEVRFSCYISLK